MARLRAFGLRMCCLPRAPPAVPSCRHRSQAEPASCSEAFSIFRSTEHEILLCMQAVISSLAASGLGGTCCRRGRPLLPVRRIYPKNMHIIKRACRYLNMHPTCLSSCSLPGVVNLFQIPPQPAKSVSAHPHWNTLEFHSVFNKIVCLVYVYGVLQCGTNSHEDACEPQQTHATCGWYRCMFECPHCCTDHRSPFYGICFFGWGSMHRCASKEKQGLIEGTIETDATLSDDQCRCVPACVCLLSYVVHGFKEFLVVYHYRQQRCAFRARAGLMVSCNE